MLIGALGDLLAAVPPDPFIPEVVAVPARGIERWIGQELAERLGITANVEFPTLSGLVERALAAAGSRLPGQDPWSRDNLRWWVAAAIDECRGEPWMATVDRFVASGRAEPRLMEAAARISHLFHRYGSERPSMVIAWANGSEVGPDDSALGGDHIWQPRLWASVREAAGVPSPAERLDGAAAAIASGAVEVGLPDRVCVYGVTRIPAASLRVLGALGETREMHLFVLHPSPVRAAAAPGAISPGPDLPGRSDPPSEGGNPVVSSWGRDSLELQALLHHHGMVPAVDHESPGPPPQTMLRRLQADIRADRPATRSTPPHGDRSIQVHACHGPARQVEVLRDALLHLMTADTSIQPRDVVIMCPDVERYAPLAEAVFGPMGSGAGALPDLRLRVADRSPRATNPLLVVMERLLDLTAGRIGAGDVLDFAALEPVGRALGVGEDELAEITELAADAGVRWGLDAEHRAGGWGVPPFDDHTWRFGLERLLAGVYVPDTRTDLVGAALPLPGVEGSTLTNLGSLAELVARVSAVAHSLTEPRPAERWKSDLIEAVGMLADTAWGDEWQWEHLARTLEESLAGTDGRPVSRHDARTALTGIGEGRAGRSNHRSGQLTLCSLVPMRSVPHRVVALLGIDDETFPRHPGRDGDDLLQDHQLIGDRDPASEDRQLLLDALLAAGDHLVIVYSGHDERTNAERPPAVPVAELLDVIDRTFAGADGRRGRHLVVRHHPLQGFDPSNFGGADLPPWGFDGRSLEGAMAMTGTGEPVTAPFLGSPLDWERPPQVALDDFARFLEEPVKGFVTSRVGFRLPELEARVEDLIPVQLDPLQAWAIGDRLLRGRLAGDDPNAQWAAERRRGSLPPGRLADPVTSEVEARVAAIFEVAAAAGVAGPGGTAGIDLTLPGGSRLVGSVSGVHRDRLGIIRYSRIKSRHFVGAFIRVVALTLGDPEIPWEAAVIGRGDRDPVTRVRIGPLGPSPEARRGTAVAALETLADLWDRGMREPLPIYPETTGAFARADGEPWKKARAAWFSTYDYRREDKDPYNVLVLGGVAPIDALWEAKPRSDERGPDWPAAGSRFEAYARRLWDPVLAVMEEIRG